MPKTRAMLLRENGARLEPVEVERPVPQAGQVLIKMGACGVGLTVVNYLEAAMGLNLGKLPRIPGHEIVGTIAEVGPGVSPARVGDRVVSYGYLSCGHCTFCRRAKEPLCLNLAGLPGVATDGGYAEYTVLPEINVVPLPDNIPFVEATAIPDAITTSYHVCNSRANVRPGDYVMIMGAAGGVGVHLIQMAKVFGGDVIAVDIDDAKLARTKEYGASWLVNYRDPQARGKVLAATDGQGPDVVVELVGRPETITWSIDLLARAGRLVTLTAFEHTFPVGSRQLVRGELTLAGSRYASKYEEVAAIELVRAGKVRPVVSEVVPLERVDELHDKLRRAEFFARGATTP